MAAVVCPALFAWQCWVFLHANSQTYDEAMHIAAGWLHLAHGDFTVEPQNPPLVKMLLALPLRLGWSTSFNPQAHFAEGATDWHVGLDFLFGSSWPAERVLAVARMPNVGLGVALVCLIGWWAHRLWGPQAAIAALVLAAADPNLVAHSSLATTDVGATLCVFATLYLLWEHVQAPSLMRLLGVGVATGTALITKYSCTLLPGIVSGVALGLVLLGGRVPLPGRHAPPAKPIGRCFEAAAALGLVAVVAVLLIPSVYSFRGWSIWWAGLGEFLRLGGMGQPAFFLGEYAYLGWWTYFPVALLLKMPVGTLALVGGSLLLWRAEPRLTGREVLFLFVPVVVFLAVLSQARINIGVRHALPVYPFFLVVAARLAALRTLRPWLTRGYVGVGVVATAVSSVHAAPHQLAYFNELVGGPGQGYRYLSDSAVDWGQDLYTLRDYLAREGVDTIYLSYFGAAPPEWHGIRYQYVPGCWPLTWPPHQEWVPADARRELLAVSVTNLQGTAAPWADLFGWLYARTPVVKLGYSIFVYDITGDVEGHLELTRGYLGAGLYEAAAVEARKVLRLNPMNARGAQLLAEATRAASM